MSTPHRAGLLMSMVASAMLAVPSASALPRKGRTKHEHCGDRYAVEKVSTIKGKVHEVARENQERGVEGLHLQLAGSGDSTLSVHLGPSGYLEEQRFSIKEGDELTVTGSLVTCNGQPMLLASSVEKNGRTVTLRDAKGIPLWRKAKSKL